VPNPVSMPRRDDRLVAASARDVDAERDHGQLGLRAGLPPLLCGADVCDVLGLANVTEAPAGLAPDELTSRDPELRRARPKAPGSHRAWPLRPGCPQPEAGGQGLLSGHFYLGLIMIGRIGRRPVDTLHRASTMGDAPRGRDQIRFDRRAD
jgi:hypothetical protein